MKENLGGSKCGDKVRQRGDGGSLGCGSKDATRAGFTEEVTFDPRHQGDKEVSYADIWGRSIPGRGSSAKALRQRCGWWIFLI